MTESVLPDWDLTALACTGAGADSSTSLGDRKATLDIDAGETVVCTFTNTKRAELEIVKATDPASFDKDFAFGITGATASDFDADGSFSLNAKDAASDSQKAFVRPGSYSTTETVPAGWTLTSIACLNGANADGNSTNASGSGGVGPAASINVSPGESLVCTFTNTKDASLKVVKVTDPASDPQDFDFDLTGSGVPADLDLDTDAGDATLPSEDSFTLDASELGAHTVTESTVAGWALTALVCTGGGGDSSTSLGERKATLDIDAGENVVCTFTNTKGASLTVIKVTDPASDPQDFDFDLTGAAVPADLDLDTDASERWYAVAGDVPGFGCAAGRPHGDRVGSAGWDLTAWSARAAARIPRRAWRTQGDAGHRRGRDAWSARSRTPSMRR